MPRIGVVGADVLMVAHGASVASLRSEGRGDDDEIGVDAGGGRHGQRGASWAQTWWLLIRFTVFPVPASGDAVVQAVLQPGWNSA